LSSSYSNGQQGWRYIADRTGIISYACLPWLWMFAGRNNIFLWLTGWSFATFNIFHRHIARWATLCAIVHSINWSVLEAECTLYPRLSVFKNVPDDGPQPAILPSRGQKITGIWEAW
jgi:hypothetical protein